MNKLIKTKFEQFINEEANSSSIGMKQLLVQALDNAFAKLEMLVPQTKKTEKSISIIDVEPLQLTSFMKNNNIPDDAYFSGTDNGYDGFDDIVLAWEVDIPNTENDKLIFKVKRFESLAGKFVYDLLTNNGYKRIGYNTALLKQFNDTTLYDMYMKKDFDRLVSYYSLSFKDNN